MVRRRGLSIRTSGRVRDRARGSPRRYPCHVQPLALVLVLAAGCFAPRTRAGTVDLPVRYGVTALASSGA